MDAQLTAELKTMAKEAGADLVGIGSMDRFEGAPKEWDPRYIFPDARAIVALGFRVPRGYFRGAEEGTFFYGYPSMGYANINEIHAPTVLHRVACFLEDYGYEAIAIRNHGRRGTADVMDGSTDIADTQWEHTRSVRPGLPPPDVALHSRIAAFICGLGEIGFSKVFLTPEFGPRQRFAFILTEAPLSPDPIYDGPPLCDRCMQCVRECPGALTGERTVKLTVAGRELEWSDLDPWYCYFAYASGLKELNPFLPDDAYDEIPDGDKIMRGEKRPTKEEALKIVDEILPRYYRRVPQNPTGYNPAMCNGRGCMRACFQHLEQQGKLKNKFHQKFRRRAPWWKERE